MTPRMFALILFVIVSVSVCAAQQQAYSVLYSFQGYNSGDGGHPAGPLVADSGGNLYGITGNGGPTCAPIGCGTVFELSPPAQQGGAWTETVLYDFQPVNDGNYPVGGLVRDQAGNLYGVTFLGGTSSVCTSGQGCGTVFELSPPSQPGGSWTETILYSFNGGNDGWWPYGSVISDSVGNLYGTTSSGGGGDCTDGCGTVYELSPPSAQGGIWTEQVLFSFNKQQGAFPHSSLTLDSKGNLYGTTYDGGDLNYRGCYYGNLRYGCGTAFEVSPPTSPGSPWTGKVLYAFGSDGSATDGTHPESNLIFDSQGSLYSTTAEGGTSQICLHDCGAVFELSAKGSFWNESIIYNFGFYPPSGGANPIAGLVFDTSGDLWGTTYDYSYCEGKATVFELVPPGSPGELWSEVTVHEFGSVPDDACGSTSDLMLKNGTLYGATTSGGTSGWGTIFSVVVAPFISLSPTTFDFGSVALGFHSSTTVKVTNTGATSLNITSVMITGNNAGDFGETNSCKNPIAPQAECKIHVGFAPSILGLETASVVITDNVQGSPQSIPLSGTGVTSVTGTRSPGN